MDKHSFPTAYDDMLFDERSATDCDGIPFDEPFSVASATECTGLMPFAPKTNSQIDSYEDIYDVPLNPIVAKSSERNE